MSFSPQQTKPKTQPLPIEFTTSQVIVDTLQKYFMRYIELVITNNDPTNSLTFRVEPQGSLMTVPPNSQGQLIDEIHNYLEINPNGATGTGLVVAQLAETTELQRLGLV
jgi:hypothetical protein